MVASVNPPTDAPRLSLWRLPAMQLLALYTLAGFTGMFATMSSLPAWLAGRGTSESVAGLVTTTLLVTTVGAQSLVPTMTRRFGLAAVLGAGCVFLGLPSLGFLYDGGLGWVLGISAVRGIGFGAITVTGSMLTARVAPPERRGEAIGIYGLAIAVPNVLAVAGGVALVSAGLFGVVAILGAVPLLGLPTVGRLAQLAGPEPDETGDVGATDTAASRRSRRDARVVTLGPAVVLTVVTLTSSGFLTYLPITRPDGALASVAILVWGITESVSRWGVGPLADRIGDLRRLLPAASATNIIGIGLVGIGLGASGSAGTATLLVGAAILGVGYGSVQNLTLIAAFARARQRETSTVSSVWNIGFDTGTATGAALVGPLIPALGPAGAIAAPAVLVAASAPLAIRSARTPEPDPPDDRSAP